MQYTNKLSRNSLLCCRVNSMPPKRRGVRGKQAKANADFSGNEGTPEDEVALALAMATVERLTKQYTVMKTTMN